MEVNNEFFDYDKVVIATHADEALSLITDPTKKKKVYYLILNIRIILP